ncbi:extracellular solute-binding protein [Saccharomonospora sp. NPDC046836]|uniref:ABC transporter substrate-binding protein n=1 Tax=Saccharomonospora sp. NPDC046836 TaxID=3156921 RepID=UPI00340D2539
MRSRRTAMKRAAIGVVMALGASACASPAPATGAHAMAYNFWGTPQRAKQVAELADAYRSAYGGPRIDPQMSSYGSYVEQLTIRAAGDDVACLSDMQTTFMAQYAEHDLLRPLDDLVDSGVIDVSGIPDDVLDTGRVDGSLYMIPIGSILRTVAYNERLLESVGASPPAAPWTWEQYRDWLVATQERLPEGVHATELEGGDLYVLESFVSAHGYRLFDDDQLGFPRELLAQWFDFWISLMRSGVTVPPELLANQDNNLEISPLAVGQAASASGDIPQVQVIERT